MPNGAADLGTPTLHSFDESLRSRAARGALLLGMAALLTLALGLRAKTITFSDAGASEVSHPTTERPVSRDAEHPAPADEPSHALCPAPAPAVAAVAIDGCSVAPAIPRARQ
jgi:hypothetical protein